MPPATRHKPRCTPGAPLTPIPTATPAHARAGCQVPPNGLVLYTGTIMTEDGKEKKVNIDFEPFKPINTSLYLCDNKFHTEALAELLESDNRWGEGCSLGEGRSGQVGRVPVGAGGGGACWALRGAGTAANLRRRGASRRGRQSPPHCPTHPLTPRDPALRRYGFIVMDGNGTLFGTLSGNTREILHKFTVDLPKKHGRGGQSALRFARLRMEKRHNYVRKVAELATQIFITNDRPNVAGLVLSGRRARRPQRR